MTSGGLLTGIAEATVPGRSGSLVLIALLLACHTDSTPTSGVPSVPVDGPKPDIVVITLDTTRADRIGAYGYTNAKTETLDTLSAQGTRFDRAYSVLPLTIPAHASIFTGLYPYHHGVRSNGDSVLGPSFVTLAERLHDAGWSTAASVGAFVTTRQWGFNQGFDAYFDTMPQGEGKDRNFWHNERPGNEVVDDALGWLAGQPPEKPTFLWIHLYDPHFPYETHADQGETFKERPYDGEMAFIDDQIARVVGAFSGRDVLWAIIGDHGEGHGEHGEAQHGLYSYNATARVPFILSGHGVAKAVVQEPVSAVDLVPTVLKLVGQPVPADLDGVPQPGAPQVPYVESYQLTERFRLAPHRAVVSGNYKLINTPQPELYDMTADIGETTNLALQKPEEVARLQKVLADKQAAPPGAPGPAMDADTVAQLAALGYISGDGFSGVDIETLPDPKGYVDFLNKINHIELALKKKSPDEGLAFLDELIAMRPEAFELRMRRINLLARLKRTEEIRPAFEQLTKEFPDKARPWVTLAGMALHDNNVEGALEMAEKAVGIEPGNAPAQEAVVEALFRLKRAPEAVTRATAWMKENPANFGVAALLGQHYLGAKDLAQAEIYLRIAVQGPNPRRAVRGDLAILALAGGFREDAYTLLEGEVKDYPGNVLARRLLARMYGDDARWLDEKLQLQALLAPRPKDVMTLVSLAQAEFNLQDYAASRVTLNKALALAPEEPQVLLLHANLLAKEGKRDEGYVVFQKASKLNDERAKAAGKNVPAAVPGPAAGPVPSAKTPAPPAKAPAAAANPPGGATP